jgi:hypothetical protein
MKLYTEEQVRDALDNEDFAYIANIVIAQMQPIELPTNEFIEKTANTQSHYEGAMWLKQQILNQNK